MRVGIGVGVGVGVRVGLTRLHDHEEVLRLRSPQGGAEMAARGADLAEAFLVHPPAVAGPTHGEGGEGEEESLEVPGQA